jgi:tRNA uridine 5-carbamoylmethylation protein Kti12
MFALVLTGPPGAGKSEVASYLHDTLGDEGVDAALIEVDALERSYPPIDRERSISHLRMLATSYREVGSELLLITATLEDDEYRLAVLAAAAADDHLLVRLEADPETMRERLLSREPPGWSGLPELLNSSRRLAISMKNLAGVGITLSTDGRQPAEVAAAVEVELRSRWQGGDRR